MFNFSVFNPTILTYFAVAIMASARSAISNAVPPHEKKRKNKAINNEPSKRKIQVSAVRKFSCARLKKGFPDLQHVAIRKQRVSIAILSCSLP